MIKIAIIGTAGRDKSMPHTRDLWLRMQEHLWKCLQHPDLKGQEIMGVSGGAAWADHLLVSMINHQVIHRAQLHLPAPWDWQLHQYDNIAKCGQVSNWHHQRFSKIVGRDTCQELETALGMPGVQYRQAPATNNLGMFFKRNSDVVAELNPETDGMFAYTWGRNDVADGGTKDTWDKFRSDRKNHFSLWSI